MSIRVIVFDFDGTLVDSNALKYDAYFEVLPEPSLHPIIRSVLQDMYEESRYVILAEVMRRAGQEPAPGPVNALADAYGRVVLAGVKRCPARDGAQDVLDGLSGRFHVYLSSTTPEEALRDIVTARGWTRYFEGIYGYPARKQETLKTLMRRHQAAPTDLLVVGDGESDRRSAAAVGARYLYMEPGGDIRRVLDVVGVETSSGSGTPA